MLTEDYFESSMSEHSLFMWSRTLTVYMHFMYIDFFLIVSSSMCWMSYQPVPETIIIIVLEIENILDLNSAYLLLSLAILQTV